MPIALHNAVDDDESSEASYRRITPAEFAKLDPNTVTLLDLREPADFAAHPVEGAINAPLDPLAHVLKTVPDVYLEVQHPCWSCNSNSSSANASAGVR